jgi:PAS domain S-box-containing protein
MWFATRSGIAVYDGLSWQSFSTKDGLSKSPVFRIRADRAGRIWALADAGVEGIIVNYHSENNAPGETAQTKTAKTWQEIDHFKGSFILTSFQLVELEQKQREADKPIIAVGTLENGLFLWRRGKWRNITEKDGLPSNIVNGLAVLGGTLYIATEKGLSIIKINMKGKGGFSIDNRLNRLPELSSAPGPGNQAVPVRGICIEVKDKYPGPHLQHSRVWLYTYHWLGYFRENRFKMTVYPLEGPLSYKDRPVRLSHDYRSGLYAGNKYELYYFNFRTPSWKRLGVKNGLSGNGGSTIFADFEKNIWIASLRGVSKISSRRFANFQQQDGLLEDEVTAVLEYQPGKFVLGHERGLTFYNENKLQPVPFPKKIAGIPLCRVLDMKADSKKNLWVALSRAGLLKVDLQQVHRHREINGAWYHRAHGLPTVTSCLWIDKQDRVWVGTSQGIFLYTDAGKGNGTHSGQLKLRKINEFPDVYLRRITGLSRKLRYAGSVKSGFFERIYSKQNNAWQWKNYRVPKNKKLNSVYAIHQDSKERLLIGTMDGLYTLENGDLRKFRGHGFQVDRPVYFIVEDKKKRLWFGTDNGVVRWDGKEATGYSMADGLVGHETNRAAGLVDSRGRIWIGTNLGVSIYDEAFDSNEAFDPAPKIHLRHLEVPGRRIPLRGEPGQSLPIRLGPHNNSLVFHFRGISFTDETAVRFKNRLDGLDRQWSGEHYPNDQMIRYPNLLPGTYRFHIKVRNVHGVWSETAVSPEIIILTPWHKKWWFYGIIALIVGGILYTILQLVLGKRQAALLEKEVEKRTHQLQAVEKQYRSLFEESKDVVFIVNPEGKLIDVNPAGVELFGHQSKEEVIGTYVTDYYINPADREGYRKEIETRGFVKDYEITLRRRDGDQINVLITATVVRDKTGKITAYHGIMRDITNQKILEQRLFQAQKMEAIGTLAGGIAHDFNNILGVILGYTELLMDDLPEESQEHLNTRQILTAAERARELVKQILAFSRQSNGERQPVKLSAVINEAFKLLRSTLPSTIDIRQDIRVNANADWVLADATRIHQVMMNLGANAAHAMSKNGGVMEVILDEVVLDPGDVVGHKELKPGPYLRLTVSDTGHGISPEVMERIFDPFFTTKDPGEGTGMGLAVIHGIIKNHGGNITAYSKPGKGSSFHVYLPRLEEEAELKSTLTEEIPGGSERILLVDDESALTQVGKQILERLGYKVEGKSNPLEALENLRNAPEQFDLIISDVTMPHMTGIQLAMEAKHIRAGIPVILCSGFSTTITMEEIKSIGVNDFIMKPIIRSELARIVRRVLDESRK